MIPAIVEFVDIAGLVAGASKGEGLGNQFLANIRETDAIAHVVRCFEDDNVVHVAGKVDPVSDIETIDTELALADLATVEKQLAKYGKAARAGGDKEAQRIVAALEKVLAGAERRPARRARATLSRGRAAMLQPFFLLTMKPALYVANVRRARLRRTTRCSTRSRRTRRRKARRSSRSAPRSKRRSPTSTAKTRRCSSPTWA